MSEFLHAVNCLRGAPIYGPGSTDGFPVTLRRGSQWMQQIAWSGVRSRKDTGAFAYRDVDMPFFIPHTPIHERFNATGHIESLLLDGQRHYFGHDPVTDRILSPMIHSQGLGSAAGVGVASALGRQPDSRRSGAPSVGPARCRSL